MECGNAQLGEIFNKNNFRRRSWDGHVQFRYIEPLITTSTVDPVICMKIFNKNRRVVHGSSASDNCMRQEKGNNGNGNPIHLWTDRNVDNFGRCWNERSAAPGGHSAGTTRTFVAN